jgi:hypothetical protein
MENFNQLCVWPGVVLEDENGSLPHSEFESWMANQFNGVRIKMIEEVKTLPNYDCDGNPVPETGNRNDLFFYVHDEDLTKFAVPRLQAGIRWWEDVLGNGGGRLYEKSILEKYPKTW